MEVGLTILCHITTVNLTCITLSHCHVSPCHHDVCRPIVLCHKQSGMARNQAMITAMLNKTDEKYKAVEGESHDSHMTVT